MRPFHLELLRHHGNGGVVESGGCRRARSVFHLSTNHPPHLIETSPLRTYDRLLLPRGAQRPHEEIFGSVFIYPAFHLYRNPVCEDAISLWYIFLLGKTLVLVLGIFGIFFGYSGSMD